MKKRGLGGEPGGTVEFRGSEGQEEDQWSKNPGQPVRNVPEKEWPAVSNAAERTLRRRLRTIRFFSEQVIGDLDELFWSSREESLAKECKRVKEEVQTSNQQFFKEIVL